MARAFQLGDIAAKTSISDTSPRKGKRNSSRTPSNQYPVKRSCHCVGSVSCYLDGDVLTCYNCGHEIAHA